eukprot:TRINITY_DN320_c0_g1_i2.p1 TRINITY_DN320_c0_g1~~TRINITY_DN320_c0_g1_i2.p1  ORF type:complete len:249 (+),score=16.10 TRINITY_DN320_c0_g1_i2:229-975(+)
MIFLVKDMKTCKPFVLKAIKDTDSYKREINALRRVKFHNNVISLLGYSKINSHHCLYLEHYAQMNLKNYIQNFAKNGIIESYGIYLFSQIASGFSHIHSCNISHHDIKSSNILIDIENRNVKIIDFGFSLNVLSDNWVQYSYGTPLYSAPEVLLHEKHNPLASDMWSIGVVLYEMLVGCLPWGNPRSIDDLLDAVLRTVVCFPDHSSISIDVVSLINGLLSQDPVKRGTSMQLVSHVSIIQQKLSAAG